VAAPAAPVEEPQWRPAGWAPPAGAPAAVLPPATEQSESGVPVWEALAVTVLALGGSLALQLAMRGQEVDQYDHALRKGLVVTLFFYLGLGGLVGIYVVLRGVRVQWHRGSALAAVALGFPVGALGGMLAVGLNSAVRGHLSGDPNVELLVGGGGGLRIFVALMVTSVMAPLVEETVFRGICAGSLLAKGSAAALWISAIAFAVWHMQPESLRYYALMGLLLGRLWQKRGLLASMTAHAAFNGALTLAAIAAVGGGPTQFTHVGAVTFRLPGGWHSSVSPDPSITAFSGPGGASLAVVERGVGQVVSPEDIVSRLQTQERSGVSFDVTAGSEQVVDVRGVAAVQADITVQGQPGHVVVVPVGTDLYSLIVVTGGSPNGEHGWRDVLKSLEIA
jgi:membrane protease YdiL (CAAX protease family)